MFRFGVLIILYLNKYYNHIIFFVVFYYVDHIYIYNGSFTLFCTYILLIKIICYILIFCLNLWTDPFPLFGGIYNTNKVLKI